MIGIKIYIGDQISYLVNQISALILAQIGKKIGKKIGILSMFERLSAMESMLSSADSELANLFPGVFPEELTD